MITVSSIFEAVHVLYFGSDAQRFAFSMQRDVGVDSKHLAADFAIDDPEAFQQQLQLVSEGHRVR